MDPHPSRLQLDIAEASPDWAAAIPGLDGFCRATAQAVLAAAPAAPPAAEVSLLLAGDTEVRTLNREWRGKDAPTNVLSFPAAAPSPPGAPRFLGDVALAFETVAREASAQRKDFAAHTRHLLVHGLLHLLGHDHEEEDAAERMEALERRILESLGVGDPYAATEPANG